MWFLPREHSDPGSTGRRPQEVCGIQCSGGSGIAPRSVTYLGFLESDAKRSIYAGVKEFSDWPTIPQLYLDKEFVGGCDILMSMHQNGELAKLLETKDVLVAADQ